MSLLNPKSAVAVLAVCLAGVTLSARPATANELKSKLEAVQHDLELSRATRARLVKAAQQAAASLRDVKQRGVGLARQLYRHSAEAGDLEVRLDDLEKLERTKALKMVRRRTQLAATLAALQRIARMPAATLVAIPQSTDKTIRSAILLRAAIPELRQEAIGLGNDLRALAALRETIGTQKAALAASLKQLKNVRQQLAALTVKKLDLLKSTQNAERKAARKAAHLSTKAGSLRELLENLSKRRRKPALRGPDFEPQPDTPLAGVKSESIAPVTISRGSLPAPGRVITAFGEKLPNGTVSKGVSIVTRPAAPVVAPVAGRIGFAGQFRGYGNLVILELRDKGHALISGISKIDAEIGDEVLVGEPLGEMTPSTNAAPKLYFELRKRGRPINPLPSGTARRNKVSG